MARTCSVRAKAHFKLEDPGIQASSISKSKTATECAIVLLGKNLSEICNRSMLIAAGLVEEAKVRLGTGRLSLQEAGNHCLQHHSNSDALGLAH